MDRIFGVDRFVLSPLEYKRVVLTFWLSLLFIAAILCYSIFDLFEGYFFALKFDAIGIGCGFLVILLNRKGNFIAARVLLAISANLIALLFTAIQARELGMYIFSISINVGVLTAFGHERIRSSLLFMMMSAGAFLIAMFHHYERQPIPAAAHYIEQNLAVSFLVSVAASILIVYYFMRANARVETVLFSKERVIHQKNQQLIKANAELDKFFYSASHDLRAPLTSMQGLVQLMEMNDDPEHLKECIGMLKGRTENLEKFILKISEYSRNARLAVKIENVLLRNNIRENLENLRFYPRSADVKVILDIPSDLVVVTDSTRLQIIFGNLLSNAIKYHDFAKPEPFIRISCQVIPDWLLIVIEDNGIGIPGDHVDKIFGMFYRAHRRSDGAGLGLYIVRETLEKLGGRIDVTSTVGKGTLFTVFLPFDASRKDNYIPEMA